MSMECNEMQPRYPIDEITAEEGAYMISRLKPASREIVGYPSVWWRIGRFVRYYPLPSSAVEVGTDNITGIRYFTVRK